MYTSAFCVRINIIYDCIQKDWGLSTHVSPMPSTLWAASKGIWDNTQCYSLPRQSLHLYSMSKKLVHPLPHQLGKGRHSQICELHCSTEALLSIALATNWRTQQDRGSRKAHSCMCICIYRYIYRLPCGCLLSFCSIPHSCPFAHPPHCFSSEAIIGRFIPCLGWSDTDFPESSLSNFSTSEILHYKCNEKCMHFVSRVRVVPIILTPTRTAEALFSLFILCRRNRGWWAGRRRIDGQEWKTPALQGIICLVSFSSGSRITLLCLR